MAAGQWLECYAQHLPTVEINNSFYQLPEPGALEDWRKQVPDDFVFSVKASRYITHMKKLRTYPKIIVDFEGERRRSRRSPSKSTPFRIFG